MFRSTRRTASPTKAPVKSATSMSGKNDDQSGGQIAVLAVESTSVVRLGVGVGLGEGVDTKETLP